MEAGKTSLLPLDEFFLVQFLISTGIEFGDDLFGPSMRILVSLSIAHSSPVVLSVERNISCYEQINDDVPWRRSDEPVHFGRSIRRWKHPI